MAGEGLATDIQYLKGVGPRRAATLRKLGIQTAGDMLWYLPRRYDDRRNIPPISMARPGSAITVKGRLIDLRSRPTRGGKVFLKATVSDGSAEIDLVWFNQPWIAKELKKVEGEIIAYGTVKEGRERLEMNSPEWEQIAEQEDEEEFARIVPVYALKEGVQQRSVRAAAKSAAEFFAPQVADPLPSTLLQREGFRPLSWCLQQMHMPSSMDDQGKARRRLAFEEFFYLQVTHQMRRNQARRAIGTSFPISRLGEPGFALPTGLFRTEPKPIWEDIHALLPFELTGAQKRCIKEIFRDLESPHPMNRLLQGDVGSGKTAVAASAMLAAARCGWQAAIMAPTEILAEQHYIVLKRLFEPLGIEVALLVGKQGAKERRQALERAASGEAPICVGTHALIQEGVEFHRLGLIVIDEQHRFGVLQRAALREKGKERPDVLVMTATPIPRTLQMTHFGDLDVSTIDEMPPGRKPIKTHWKRPYERREVYKNVRKLLEGGRQAYFVCPLISESAKMQTQAAEDLFYRLQKEFPTIKVGLLHGQMKPAEKEATMEAFRAGDLQALVATVVIEVGVDVPNASVMVIEDANRFGLSQLHQLRGRVGRGAEQSFCVLIAEPTTPESERRIAALVRTVDGFEIADEDMRIRGPGEIAGTEQHGHTRFLVGDIIEDVGLLNQAREAAKRLLEADPGLDRHAGIAARLGEQRRAEALVSVS